MAYIYALRGDTDRQGVYCFEKAQTLGTLLRAAGEALPAAMDPGLAIDGGTLLFFRNGTMRVQRMEAFERLALHIPLSLNRVTAEELCVIPGIGSATAQAIVSHRDRFGLFQQLSELAAVPGIGEKKLRAVTAYLTVSD
ncbi:MAG: hypothetical protein GY868_06980 [Deltaproteobacteria bacterium]|nr:hypothetical protein [Deltaproteobacteria bacterium]